MLACPPPTLGSEQGLARIVWAPGALTWPLLAALGKVLLGPPEPKANLVWDADVGGGGTCMQ